MENFFKFQKTASSKLQFKINNSIIFNYIREKAPISRAEISKDLKISAPAVSRAIEKLISKNYIFEAEKMKTKSGKRPTLIKINKNRCYVIGIDLGKEKIKIALINFVGEIVEKIKGFKIYNNKKIIKSIIKEIEVILAKYYKTKNSDGKIEAICIGAPADIDKDSGEIISAPLYSKWKKINLKAKLEDIFNIPVYIENDVNLSALGEKYYGEGKKYEDIVFVEISNGIGAGIIIGNTLIRGESGSAGEIGFTIVDSKNLGFKTIDKGFLEKHASLDSIKRKAIKEIKNGRESKIIEIVSGNINKISSPVICEAAIKKDKLAIEIIEEVVNLLSVALINIILILNPPVIVLGGEICNLPKVDELIVNPIIEKIKETLPLKLPVIKLSSLGEDPGIIGASFLAIETIISKEFPYKIDKII